MYMNKVAILQEQNNIIVALAAACRSKQITRGCRKAPSTTVLSYTHIMSCYRISAKMVLLVWQAHV